MAFSDHNTIVFKQFDEDENEIFVQMFNGDNIFNLLRTITEDGECILNVYFTSPDRVPWARLEVSKLTPEEAKILEANIVTWAALAETGQADPVIIPKTAEADCYGLS